MSLAIDVNRVWRVLLADGWHDVADLDGDPEMSSFDLDAYEFVNGAARPESSAFFVFGGGREDLIPATGFLFTDLHTGATVYGPLTSVLAVSTTKRAAG